MTDELVEVTLLELPLETLARAQERSDELAREFSHIAETDTETAPARLTALSRHLRGQYGAHVSPAQDAIAAAMERGDEMIDVTFVVPPAAASAVDQLLALLDESDEFCRSGELLTLATPPDLVAFRRWYLGEFKRQIGGAEPLPWSRYAASAPA